MSEKSKSARHDTQQVQKKAVLVGIQLPRMTEQEVQSSLAELGRLVHTLGYEVVGSMTQKRSGTGSAVIVGEGKLRELARWTGGTGKIAPMVEAKKSKAALKFAPKEEEEAVDDSDEDLGSSEFISDDVRADVVVFDNELTPSQTRNLESATGATVLDRTGVIIEIFSRHARTPAARLQVEIARLKYLAPRMRETGNTGDREGGGIGGKGAGETSAELDRRRIRDRIKELKDELEEVQNEHQVRRSRRSGENCVALVGYTNAGKSSLMRAMTGSEILVADKLFATLDTTVRPLYPESMPKVLLSDTVGFIKKLPHDLVASFRSTLDEALNADLLLYTVDASDPTFRQQLEVTRDVMKEVGADETPSRLILNKQDKLSAEEYISLRTEFPDAIFLSTRDPNDLQMLREQLQDFFEQGMVDQEIHIPYSVQGAVGEVRAQMRVLNETYDNDGVVFTVRAKPEAVARFRAKYSI